MILNKKIKRFIAAVLSVIMLLSIFSLSALAVNQEDKTDEDIQKTSTLSAFEAELLSKRTLREMLYSIGDTDTDGTVYHSSEYEATDIKTVLYSDKLVMTFPSLSGKYMIRAVDLNGNEKILKIVNAGESCTISSRMLPSELSLITVSHSTDDYHYLHMNYFGPLRTKNGVITYDGRGAYARNEYYMNKLSEMTSKERELLLSPTPTVQSDNAEIAAKTRELTKNKTSDFEKIRSIYNFVSNHIYYDYDSLDTPKPKPAVDAVSAYKTRVAICEGYTSLLLAMLKAAGIPAIRCVGFDLPYFVDISNNTVSSGFANHSWVSAYIDGKWRFFDATHDSLNKLENGVFTGTQNSLENWEYFAIPLERLSSYRRFDGFKSEITTPDTHLNFAGGKKTVSVNPDRIFIFRAELEPVWSDASGVSLYISPENYKFEGMVKNSSEIETRIKFEKIGTYNLFYKSKINGQPEINLGNLKVEVSNKPMSISDIAIQSKPYKTSFKSGESFNTNGLKLSVLYENGTAEEISKGFSVLYQNIKKGENSIKINYGGKTTSYNVFLEDASILKPKTPSTPQKLTNPTKPQKPTTPTTPSTPSKPASPTVKKLSMHRLYNPNSGEHFYTKDTAEKNHLVSVGWKYEGIGWNAPDSSKTPVYRLYNPNAGEHHYTMKKSERDMLIKAGWNYEGIGWYSDDAKSVPLYRQYNPNAYACNHNYTKSKSENDRLVGLGWKYEGIGWYGVK